MAFLKRVGGGFPRMAMGAVRRHHCESNAIKTVTLNNGAKMPMIGIGTWLARPGEVHAAIAEALKIGYNHVDCAHVYYNEEEVGAALEMAFSSGYIKREDLWITSKLWCADFAPDDVLRACERTLKDLHVDHLDLYLMHWPIRIRKGAAQPGQIDPSDQLGYSRDMVVETWREMEKLVERGLVRAIGVSNFTERKLFNFLEDIKTKPAVHQVECHPYFQQRKMKEFCTKSGIQFQSYSPLGAPERPPRNREANAPLVMADQALKEIAAKHSCSVAQVAIAWQYQSGVPLLVKSVHAERIAQNLAAKDIHLEEGDMAAIDALDRNARLLFGRFGYKANQTVEDFWDGENIKPNSLA
eukprot:scpid33188/ scgid14555/ Aldo-keto reductase family 4 member C9